MSSHTPGRRVRAKCVRKDGGDRVETGEEEADYVNERADQGSQGATGGQVVLRTLIIERDIFRAAAMCLTVLCVLVVARTTGMVMDYHTDNNQLVIKLTQERDQLLNNLTFIMTKYNNLKRGQERDQVLNLTLTNLTLPRDLQSEVNQLKKEIADKSCSSGWQKVGDVFYSISTEEKTWEESKQQCEQTGARLVVIDSQEKRESIRGLNCWKGASFTWIGLSVSQGKWTWVDEKPMGDKQGSWSWASGFPVNQDNHNCAYLYRGDGKWRNGLCSQTHNWICEIQISK